METPNRFVSLVAELRKTVLYPAVAILCLTVGFYFISPAILGFLQSHLKQKLVFFAVSEPFLAHVKTALFIAVFLTVPLIFACLWRSLGAVYHMSARRRALFLLFSSILFYSGAGFCYLVTLPFGINFLLGFASAQLHPVISVDKFVTFVTLFILAFGLIFELPILMFFAAATGICSRKTFAENRRYAIMIISIVSAILTPTPDVVNMLLMGGPLYFLYEVGIMVLKAVKIA